MSQHRPAKSLQSAKVANSLRRNVLPIISKKNKALSCRALWHTTENIDPTQRIAENRHALDSILKDLPGIDFFFSCITGTKSNSNSKYSLIRPGIAYFIVHKKSKDVNEETVFKTFHDSGFLPTMSAMKNNQANKVDSMLNLLKQVVKGW